MKERDNQKEEPTERRPDYLENKQKRNLLPPKLTREEEHQTASLDGADIIVINPILNPCLNSMSVEVNELICYFFGLVYTGKV